MTKSKSQRALILFVVIATPFMLWQALDWPPRPYFLGTEGSDGTATLQRQMSLHAGLRIHERGTVQTQFAPAVLEYEGTSIDIDERTILEIQDIEHDALNFFSSRGHWTIHPDRHIKTCTRAVCIETDGDVEVFYYTPGEVVEVRPSAEAVVMFNEETIELQSGERIVIDELTHEITRS